MVNRQQNRQQVLFMDEARAWQPLGPLWGLAEGGQPAPGITMALPGQTDQAVLCVEVAGED